MALFTWNDSLSVGVSKFDEQHKKLFAIAGDLHQAMLSGKGREMTAPLLAKLVDYVGTHFREEERAMEQARYIGLANHKVQHHKLEDQVQDFVKRSQAGDLSMNVALSNFLRDWLVNHIQKTDKQYSEALAGAAVR